MITGHHHPGLGGCQSVPIDGHRDTTGHRRSFCFCGGGPTISFSQNFIQRWTTTGTTFAAASHLVLSPHVLCSTTTHCLLHLSNSFNKNLHITEKKQKQVKKTQGTCPPPHTVTPMTHTGDLKTPSNRFLIFKAENHSLKVTHFK